ncbi:hypothetical protein AB0I53_06860 [Saccharopolyspora sp. NPDC050389]|uniref:hypothetical protein n=1 Tax=Saccharopolyspora sp. NPDC050389 TaxID=3155516 RepID=UPI0034021669
MLLVFVGGLRRDVHGGESPAWAGAAAPASSRGRADNRAAITGSSARDAEDRWSDVDLFFGVADGNAVADVLGDWSAFVYRELGAVRPFDLQAGSAIYRAFLLSDLLEIDLGFAPAADFRPLGDGEFRVVLGEDAQRGRCPRMRGI